MGSYYRKRTHENHLYFTNYDKRMNLACDEIKDFIQAVKGFRSIYDTLEINKFFSWFFGYDVWRKTRTAQGYYKYEPAGREKYIKMTCKYKYLWILFNWLTTDPMSLHKSTTTTKTKRGS